MQCNYLNQERVDIVRELSRTDIKEDETIEINEKGECVRPESYECLCGPGKFKPTEIDIQEYCKTGKFQNCPRWHNNSET